MHLVVADAQAQVYKAPAIASLPEYLDFIGCAYVQAKSYNLGIPPAYGSPSGVGGTRLYTLRGTIVAFEKFLTFNLEPGTRYVNEIVVRDLRNGRFLHRLPTDTFAASPKSEGDFGAGEAGAMVVKSDGAVAWIADIVEDAMPKDLITYQVHAVDKNGSRVLASGPSIEPSSLALAGSTLYWTQGGEPMSSVLN